MRPLPAGGQRPPRESQKCSTKSSPASRTSTPWRSSSVLTPTSTFLAGRAAVGLLRLSGAFSRAETGTDLAVRIGAHWCELINADVQFDLAHALVLIDESEADAANLAAGDLSDSSRPTAWPAGTTDQERSSTGSAAMPGAG